MLVSVNRSGPHECLLIVQDRREGKRVRQAAVATPGRIDNRAASGAVNRLRRSGARFAERLMVLAEGAGAEPDAMVASIGPAALFERLWRETGCRDAIRSLPAGRRHQVDAERATQFVGIVRRRSPVLLPVPNQDRPCGAGSAFRRTSLAPAIP